MVDKKMRRTVMPLSHQRTTRTAGLSPKKSGGDRVYHFLGEGGFTKRAAVRQRFTW